MIRKLLMTTAITLIATSGAMAQDNNEAATAEQMTELFLLEQGQSELATEIIGHSVYSSEAEDAEVIGDINDLVIAEDGTVAAVVIGVGGFLGVGEKDVAVSYDSIRWAQDENGDQFAVFEANRDILENAPEFTREEAETAMAPAEGTTPPPVEQPAEGEEIAEAPAEQPVETEEMAAGEQTAQPTLSDVDIGSISTEQLNGATVYAANDESVGDVGDVRIAADGSGIDAIIVDVGGFLGIGEKPVAVGLENLTIRRDEGGTYYVYTDFTREQLEAAPDYDEATYDDQRDTMRLTDG